MGTCSFVRGIIVSDLCFNRDLTTYASRFFFPLSPVVILMASLKVTR